MNISPALIILFFLLLCAFIFSIIPIKFFKNTKAKKIDLKERLTSEISSIVMFVSNLREDKDISELLAYKILSQMSKSHTKKDVWLIHGSISDSETSYRNAHLLVKKFQTDTLKIRTFCIEDSFDIAESFNVVTNVLKSVKSRDDIVFDFTSGTKPMSLGMALACADEKKLIYFPQTKENDAARYLHINIGDIIDIR